MSYLFTNGRPPYHEITPYDENKWFEEAGQLQKKQSKTKTPQQVISKTQRRFSKN